jgi:hypothetical protein
MPEAGELDAPADDDGATAELEAVFAGDPPDELQEATSTPARAAAATALNRFTYLEYVGRVAWFKRAH